MVYMDSFCGVSQNCQVRCFFVVRIQGRDLFSKVFEAIFQVSSSEKNKKKHQEKHLLHQVFAWVAVGFVNLK